MTHTERFVFVVCTVVVVFTAGFMAGEFGPDYGCAITRGIWALFIAAGLVCVGGMLWEITE